MNGLLIIGAGGHGRVIADVASGIGSWGRIAFLDDRVDDIGAGCSWPVLGKCESFASVAGEFDAVIVGFGDNALRLDWADRVIGQGLELATIISPGANVSENARVGAGTVVMPGAVVNIGASTGRCAIINTGATLDHDCHLEDAVHLAPGAHLGGGVRVGARTWIGIGAAVRHGVSIGDDVIVGVGAAVHADLPDGCTAVGVPARPME
jgi:sugar O-acyltransferase (sialic acid O-acetyltransferase NeuD family)